MSLRPETLEAVRRLISAAGFQQTQSVIAQHWDELTSPEARQLLAYQLQRHATHSREHRVISTRLRALERSVADGAAAVFSGYDAATEAIVSILNAENWDEVRNAVERNRHHLFPEVADIAFADLVMQPSTPDDEAQVLGGWGLVEQCRALGVEAALEAQEQPRRGIILGPEVAAGLAVAGTSEEEVQQRLEAVPEIASRRARRVEAETQISQWTGFAEYGSAMNALTAPSDLPQRIEVCRAAIGSINRGEIPIVWAMVALDLADALRKRAGYSGMAPMGEVIALYRDALAIVTSKGESAQFAHAQQYLGDAYLLDAGGDAGENVEAGIRCYETALGLRRRASEPIPWAAITAHLGEALLRRTKGDPAVDVDRAVGLLEQAIEVLEKSNETALLATSRVSLAVALMERISGSHDENLRRAARRLREATEDVEPDEQPGIWAMANAHLGSVYLMRARTDFADREALLKQAEHCFRAALGRAEAGPRVHARAHAGLGWALSDQAGGGADADADAITHHEAAIALYEGLGPAFDVERGHVHRNLALLYTERAFGDMEANVVAAEYQYSAALKAFRPDEYPVERRDTLRAMGTMYFAAQRWAESLRCFEEAIAITDRVLVGRYTELGKEAEVAGNRGLYGPAAYCLLRLGRPGEALLTLDRGKARMLTEALAWKELDGAGLLADQQALRWARGEIVRLEAEGRRKEASHDPAQHARLGRQLRDAYRHLAVLRSTRHGSPAPKLDLEGMLAEIPEGGALVVPIVTTQGSAALVVPAGADRVSAEHVVDLGALNVAVLAELLSGRPGATAAGWMNAYLDWRGDHRSFRGLLEALDVLLSALWDVLMGPIHGRLQALSVAEHAPVVLIPSAWLGLLPLHAAQRAMGGQWRAFGDEFVVSYVPSVGTLRACRRRLEAEERQGRTLAAVSNPTGDLRFADAEVSAIAALFVEREGGPDVARVLAAEAATRSDVLGALARRHYLHFACHAEFHWTNAAESGLRLAGGDWLRLEDVLSPAVDLRSSRLVTLSACETGMTEFRTMPDEFIGLPGAFVEAGAPTVISSLWPVDDISTKLLMTELYRLHLDGMAVAAALQHAQRWLREATADRLGLAEAYRRAYEESGGTDAAALETWRYYEAHPDVMPFAHPFHWAAFTATGTGGAC